MYTFLSELQKEQSDVEIMIRQLQLGQKVRKSKDPIRKQKDERIFNIVNNFHNYVQNNEVMMYLKNIGLNIRL